MIKRWWRRILRDFFAGCALAGEMAGVWSENTPGDIGIRAFTQADAMLKARGKQE